MTGLEVVPQGAWLRPRWDEDRDEGLSRRDLRRQAQATSRRELQAVLGVLVVNTTILSVVGGGFIGPARDDDGRVLVWSIWAPHRRVLIDVFRRTTPPMAEMAARKRFAAAHELRYAIVEPGRQLTAKSVKEWIDE